MDESSLTRPWGRAGEAYGINKAESERRLQTLAGSKLTLVRPGPIKGDRDGGSDLVTWLMRARNGGQHIGPGDGSDSVEVVDAKDVGSFLADCVDKRRLGTWNLTGHPMNFRTFLDHCKAITQSKAEFIWVPHSFLTSYGLKGGEIISIQPENKRYSVNGHGAKMPVFTARFALRLSDGSRQAQTSELIERL